MLPDHILIALAYTTAILITRCCTTNRTTLVVVTAAIAAIALAIGEPEYKALDLAAVSFAWYICHKSIRSSTTTDLATPVKRFTPINRSQFDSVISAVIIVAVVGLFYVYIFDRPESSTSDFAIRQADSTPKIQLEARLAKKPNSSSATRNPAGAPSLAIRLGTLAVQLNSGTPKPFSDRLTLLNAVANGKSLVVSIRAEDLSASVAGARNQVPNYVVSITHYYCGLEHYRGLISEGATFVVQLYDSANSSVNTTSVRESVCRI
jgi:hypothetical protein